MGLQSNKNVMDSQHGSTSTLQADRSSLTIQQRRRSHSASFHIPAPTSPHRLRTKTGPYASQEGDCTAEDQPSTSSHPRNLSGSSSKFVTSSTDFHLPKRNVNFASIAGSSTSPKSSGSLANLAHDGSQDSLSALPLFRRKAAAAVLAHASRKGYRRGSMLGKVIAGNEVNNGEDDDEDDDMEADEEEDDLRLSESPMLDKDEDEDMQIDTGDTILAENCGPSSPQLTSQRGGGTTTAVRRAVQRRTNLMPRDRGVLRVAATLRDETRPGEGEIASEAKLQRRLGPESDSTIPTTPKLTARRSQSPFGPSSGGLVDRNVDGDELYFPDPSTHYDLSDDSYDGDDDMAQTKAGGTDNEVNDTHQAGIAIPGANGQAAQKDKLWLNFREAGNARLSPGIERRSRGASVTPGGINIGTGQLSGSLGSALDQAMELESFTHNTSSSPSLWGRSAKRKVGDDRYDPYSSSAIHKRRAVSPIAFISATNGSGRGGTTTTSLSPGLLSQMSPIYNPLMATLPTPTPLSIPSPTLSFSRAPGGLSGSFPRSYPSLPANRPVSTNASPSSTRPSTPTNVVTSNPFAAIPSPSLSNTHASKQGGGSGAGVGGNVGSGPGYGSGALGLSLGGGSKRLKQEQQEMEEEEGMLGDVSAIQL